VLTALQLVLVLAAAFRGTDMVQFFALAAEI